MRFRLLLSLGAVAFAATTSDAQQDLSQTVVKVIPVAAGVYMLEGAGGNIGLSVGSDDAFMVDDQFAPLTPKIRAAIATVTSKPVRFLLNTHWHGDHTGGNESMKGEGAIIVAQDNVRRRMGTEQFITQTSSTWATRFLTGRIHSSTYLPADRLRAHSLQLIVLF